LVLEAIARQEGIEIDEVNLQEHIDGLIERAGAAREKARAFYLDPAARASVRASLLENRALDLVIERAQVRRVEISGIAEGEGNG
jgi:FKBP-type peptidyl-prolyl cis-trans isomerase (trigger factor)